MNLHTCVRDRLQSADVGGSDENAAAEQAYARNASMHLPIEY